MMLLQSSDGPAYRELAAREPESYGYLIAPGIRGSRAVVKNGAAWALDNGAFAAASEQAFLRLLDNHQPYHETCLFAVARDVIGDHQATLDLWPRWRSEIAGRGYPVAFAAQDGCTVDNTPWDEMNALFVGGTDTFKDKLSAPVIQEAKRHGLWVHVGRVNWRARVFFCLNLGVDSIDGTGFAIAPNQRLAEYHGWLREWEQNRRLL